MLLLAVLLKVNAVLAGGVAAVVIAAVAVTAIIAVVPAVAAAHVVAVAAAVAGGGFDSRFVVAEPLLPFEVQTKLGLTVIAVQRRGKKERDTEKGRERERERKAESDRKGIERVEQKAVKSL